MTAVPPTGAAGSGDGATPARPIPSDFADLRVVSARNDILVTDTGAELVDLFTGSGTVLLGHCNPAVVSALRRQAGEVWITGAIRTPPGARATELVEGFFPDRYRVAALYSTGMEAAEFALRVARVATGRPGVVGFERCLHGKSMATAYLGWHNEGVSLPHFHRLPFLPDATEGEILEHVSRTLAGQPIAAVFIEALQASAGGHMASPAFHRALARTCTEHGTLLVIDEILTGFFRTGQPMLHRHLDIAPDIVLTGKTMGNGFPVSAVVVDRAHAVAPATLPGSTYAGNPLAAAVVCATLEDMRAIDIGARVAAVDAVLAASFAALAGASVPVRGLGALRILELPGEAVAREATRRMLQAGVLVSNVGPYIRILPAATIGLDRLTQACAIVCNAIRSAG